MKQRLAVARAHHRSRLHETGKRSENAPNLPGVLEPIAVALAVAVVTHHPGQAERTERGAHPLHASANSAGDLARVQLLIICQQFNDCECYRIAEQAAQTRLPIAILSTRLLYHVSGIPKTWRIKERLARFNPPSVYVINRL
jgi:hypothetical protein